MTSSELRQAGNVKYKAALAEGLSPVIKCSRLYDAMHLYIRAAVAARGSSMVPDWSSATKNLGMVNMRLAQVYVKDDKDKEHAKTLITFRESLKFMSQALLRGVSELMGEEWRNRLQEVMEASYLEVLEIIHTFSDTKEKLREMYKITRVLLDSMASVTAKYHVAAVLLQESMLLLERGQYRECLGCLHDMHQPIEEALGILRRGNLTESDHHADKLRSDLEVLRQDSQFQIYTAESMQARKCGEALLEELLLDETSMNDDMLWDVVDWFKLASLKAAELNLEQEAAAVSYLGLINEKILLSKTKSKLYYKRCLELVEAAKPRTFNGHQWYKQCVEGFKKIQDEERQRDDVAQQEIKQEILDTMKDEIAALKKADTSASDLLEYILKHHPSPKNRTKFTKTQLDELKKTEDTNEKKVLKTRKKLLLKALQDFHPDKITKAKGETDEGLQKRKVLVEEIAKMITRYYEIIKLET